MRWEGTIKMNVTDTECWNLKWIKLAQHQIGINSIRPTRFTDVISENGLPGRLPWLIQLIFSRSSASSLASVSRSMCLNLRGKAKHVGARTVSEV
jgi:hypothetical protein